MKNRQKKTTLDDKDIFKYILGSIELIYNYLENYTIEKYERDIMIQDAVCNRMHCIGIAASDFSKDITDKYPDFPWSFYEVWIIFNDPEIIWDLVRKNNDSDEDFESLKSYFSKLEEIYLMEYYPLDNKYKKRKKTKETPWSTDYKYPIKTSKSIWTVKK
jgi:uncharacterized protein with HEPN domain